MTTDVDCTPLDEERCWRAVLARDAGLDGRFVTGVRSTGIYCRPSCPARRPKRENVVFFTGPDAAEAAGLRACLRCRPRAADGTDPSAAAMHALARHIEAHAEERLPLSRLAELAGLSPFHVQRAFSAVMGMSPRAFQEGVRMGRLKTRLRRQDAVSGAAFEVGFGSSSRMYEKVDAHLGMTPSAYRAEGAGEAVAFAVTATRLGLMLTAATDRGLCFLAFGEDGEALREELRREFPKADIAPAPAGAAPQLALWAGAIEAYLDRRGPRPDLPLDLRGTAFQLAVWRFLGSIPEGETRTYAEVAAGIGAPKAVRAAGSACGANRVALLVPCHRVLRGDGGLGGYRWGVARKRALLGAEGKEVSTPTTTPRISARAAPK